MTSRRRSKRLALIAAAAVAWGGGLACGKKGPPRAPIRVAPSAVDAVTVKRLGQDVYLRFTIPTTDTNGATPSSVTAVEVYAVTIDPARPVTLDDRTLVEKGTLVARFEVQPPPAAPAGDAAPPPDPRPAQGAAVTVVERLEGAALSPILPVAAPAPLPAAVPDDRPPLSPPLVPTVARPLQRSYAVVTRGRRGRVGTFAKRVTVPLTPAPPPPAAPVAWYDEDRLVVEWVPPDGVRSRPDEPVAGALPAKPLGPAAPVHTYNVYAPEDTGQGQPTLPVPLNAKPLDEPAHMEAPFEFGVERCFVVRTVEQSDQSVVESEPSPATCLVPRDEFAPRPPQNLTAVAGEAVVNLIWEPNEEADLAGYVVLRGQIDRSGLQLRPLTPAPIRETTYRDVDVVPGGIYVYAVVAFDTATPQNVSAESNRIEVTVR